jgi:hypothetical protein
MKKFGRAICPLYKPCGHFTGHEALQRTIELFKGPYETLNKLQLRKFDVCRKA